MRAVYGGLSLACGALFVLGLRRERWFQPSLFLVAASSAGLVLGRVYAMLVSGVPGPLLLGVFASELASCVWGFLAYRALDRADIGDARAQH